MKIILELAPFELTNELISVIRKVSIPEKGEQPEADAETPKKFQSPINGEQKPIEQAKVVNELPKKKWETTKPAEQPKAVEEQKPVQQPLLPVAEPKTFTIKDLITAATGFTRDHPEMRETIIALMRDGYRVHSINDLPTAQINAFAMDLRELGAAI